MADTGRRTITLTGRGPVTIEAEDWPQIAKAEDRSVLRGAVLVARQHEDGRAIVYGRNAAFGGGMLLGDSDDICAAIAQVAMILGLSRLEHRCLASLPPERL